MERTKRVSRLKLKTSEIVPHQSIANDEALTEERAQTSDSQVHERR